MALDDKAAKMKGEAKELTGKATDNPRVQMEGRAQKLEAKSEELLDKSQRRVTDKHDVPMD
jgi:uncharacterized protein YjbJ (UPF0337 family)